MYELETTQSCEAQIKKLTHKNKALAQALNAKISQILRHPTHYKPLGNVLAGKRRVHVGSFVLVFEAHEKRVVLLKFSHHDEAY